MPDTHRCPFPECGRQVRNDMFACRAHWFGLPEQIRNGIWSAYRRHGVGSPELREAHRSAIEWWSAPEVTGDGSGSALPPFDPERLRTAPGGSS